MHASLHNSMLQLAGWLPGTEWHTTMALWSRWASNPDARAIMLSSCCRRVAFIACSALGSPSGGPQCWVTQRLQAERKAGGGGGAASQSTPLDMACSK